MSSRLPLTDLQDHGEFARRHIGPDAAELEAILDVLDVETLDGLLDAAVPGGIRLRGSLELPPGRTEREVDEIFSVRCVLETLAFRQICAMPDRSTIIPELRTALEERGWSVHG